MPQQTVVKNGTMRLATYLDSQEFSIRQFADLIGVTPEAVRLYVTGKRTPRGPTMRRIMNATRGEVTANDFVEAA